MTAPTAAERAAALVRDARRGDWNHLDITEGPVLVVDGKVVMLCDYQFGRLVVDSERQIGVDAPEDKRTIAACKALGVDVSVAPNLVALWDSHGGDMTEWPDDLRVREWPGVRA